MTTVLDRITDCVVRNNYRLLWTTDHTLASRTVHMLRRRHLSLQTVMVVEEMRNAGRFPMRFRTESAAAADTSPLYDTLSDLLYDTLLDLCKAPA